MAVCVFVSCAGCSINPARTTLTCIVTGDLPVGGSVVYSVPVRPTQTGTFNATGTVTANKDINPTNNGPAITTITVVRGWQLRACGRPHDCSRSCSSHPASCLLQP